MNYQLVEKLKKQTMSFDKWGKTSWHYVQAVVLKSYLDDYNQTGNEQSYHYAKTFIEKLYDGDNIPDINLNYYSIDQIRMASALFQLYHLDQQPKYRKVLDDLYQQLTTTYPRTKSGNFFHKENYPNQVWLDGLYMGQPFYVEYVKTFLDKKDYSDTLRQFEQVRNIAFNKETKLYVHAYDESKQMFWCDKKTGLSAHVWARAVGWLVMAMVDVLELLESTDADTKNLKAMLKETVDGMLDYQDPSGMWYQIVNMQKREGNYLETSGTSMMVYGILKATRLGYLESSYQPLAVKAFDATIEKYLKETDDQVILGGICKSAGLGKHPDLGTIRDGSYEYYVYGEKIVENNGHGIGSFLLAYNEIKHLFGQKR